MREVEIEYDDTEPCEHCGGTGRQVKPPPPRQRGGRQPGPGLKHGYENTYTRGNCRCDLCKAARRAGVRRRRAAKRAT